VEDRVECERRLTFSLVARDSKRGHIQRDLEEMPHSLMTGPFVLLDSSAAYSARRGRTLDSVSSDFSGNASVFATRGNGGGRTGRRGSTVINMAASKEKKSRDLDMIKGMLDNENTLLVAGFRYQGLSVR